MDVGDSSPASFTSKFFKRNSPGSISIKLTSSPTGTKSKSYSFFSYIYLGGASNTTSYNTTLFNSIKSQQKSAKTSASNTAMTGNSTTATSGKRTYIIVPATFGAISDILDSFGNSLQNPDPTFVLVKENLAVGNFTGTSGFTINVDVYKSVENQALGNGDAITIKF